MSPSNKNPVRRPSLSSENLNCHPGGDSPQELMPAHPLGFLLPQAPNPNAAPPILYSFFPLSPNDMDPTTTTSTAPDMANPTPSCPLTFAPSQTVNPRSSQMFLQSQEASPASRPADSPPNLRNQCVTTDSEISRQRLEALARLIKETTKAEVARISHPGLQTRNPPVQVAKQNPKSDSKKITKTVPCTVCKATSSKFTSNDLFSVAEALGGNRLVDLVWAAYISYISKDETEGRPEPSDQWKVNQN